MAIKLNADMDKKFEWALELFDFNKVHMIMKLMDFTWLMNGKNKVPSIKKMKSHVRSLYYNMDEDSNFVSSGRFEIENNLDEVRIKFILEESNGDY